MANQSKIETPTDEVEVPKQKKSRGVRKRVLGEGEGDYCIYEVTQDPKLPKGSLIPIPNVPRFNDTMAAIKWIKFESKDLLTNKQVMIFKACELLTLQVVNRPTVAVVAKPKITMPTKAETSEG